MQLTSTSAPADNSVSISSAVTSAPRRRGRPRIHANDSAKKAAYRQRLFDRKLAALRHAAERRLHNHEPAPIKHNRGCRGKHACLCDLPMSRGLFLADAPRGRGLLISGGYGPSEISLASDLSQQSKMDQGHVTPSGWGQERDENTSSKNRPKETDYTFAEKHFQDKSWLRCYVAGCSRSVGGVILEPNDYDGSTYYCCDLHRPVRVD